MWYCANTDSNTNDCTLEGDVVAIPERNLTVGLNCTDTFRENEGGVNECKLWDQNSNGVRYCLNSGQDVIPNDCVIEDEGTTCIDGAGINEGGIDECAEAYAPNHLHLEIFIARGQLQNPNHIRINPLLMFNLQLYSSYTSNSLLSEIDPYFPVRLIDKEREILFPDALGIQKNEINATSMQGHLGDKDIGRNGFFQIQDTQISGPEWWLSSLEQPARMSAELDRFLKETGYPLSALAYIGPNCTNVRADVDIDAGKSYPVTCVIDDNDVDWNPLQVNQ